MTDYLANKESSHADLRQRYADAILPLLPSDVEGSAAGGVAGRYADAVLAVRDDELDRARREVAYVAETGEKWRQLWEQVDGERSRECIRADQAKSALARVREFAEQIAQGSRAVNREFVAAALIKIVDGPGAVSEEQTEPLCHLGGNAEDCPACDITTMPYPFICPGEEHGGEAS